LAFIWDAIQFLRLRERRLSMRAGLKLSHKLRMSFKSIFSFDWRNSICQK